MKLTMDALKERADAVASEELLLTISGGTENACHDEPSAGGLVTYADPQGILSVAAEAFWDWVTE